MSENAAPVVIHRLVKKDLTTLTGECSECGFVAIAKAGNGFQCGEKKKASQREWRERNPAAAKANRALRSDHELFNRDYVKLSASCAVCGPVDMTPWGRGYACATRAAELRTTQEAAPAKPCVECWIIDGDRVYLVGGECPRCKEGVDRYVPNHVPRERRDHGGQAARLAEEFEGSGFTVYDEDPGADMPGFESAVPGWRTVGSERPWNEV